METLQRAELLKVVITGWTLVRDDTGAARDLEGQPVTCYTREDVLATWDTFQSEVAQANVDNPMPNRQQRRRRENMKRKGAPK